MIDRLLLKHWIYLICLFLVGVINVLPVLGLFSIEQLQQTYDIRLTDPNLVILLRHRALMFGIIGGLVFYSLWKPHLRDATLIAAAISMLGFLLVLAYEGDFNEALIRIASFDLAGIICLIMAVVIRWSNAQSNRFSEF